eukprot:scaffold308574_cov22-Tisochrysis_lutea.AAC.1
MTAAAAVAVARAHEHKRGWHEARGQVPSYRIFKNDGLPPVNLGSLVSAHRDTCGTNKRNCKWLIEQLNVVKPVNYTDTRAQHSEFGIAHSTPEPQVYRFRHSLS